MNDVDFSAIPAPGHKCVVCDRDLAALGKHPTVLDVTEKGDPQRRDVCRECWDNLADNDRKFFSFWLTQREAPKPDPKIDREEQNRRLMALFEQWRDSNDDRFRPHLYVLAHTLMKRRLLKWEGTEKGEDGTERIIFRNPATDQRIQIEEMDVGDEAFVTVMREIEARLATETSRQSGDEAAPDTGS